MADGVWGPWEKRDDGKWVKSKTVKISKGYEVHYMVAPEWAKEKKQRDKNHIHWKEGVVRSGPMREQIFELDGKEFRTGKYFPSRVKFKEAVLCSWKKETGYEMNRKRFMQDIIRITGFSESDFNWKWT